MIRKTVLFEIAFNPSRFIKNAHLDARFQRIISGLHGAITVKGLETIPFFVPMMVQEPFLPFIFR